MNKVLQRLPKTAPYIVCFTAALFFAYELMQLHMMNAIAPMVMKDLHLNAASFGILSSTYLLADVIFLIPAGIILDRFSTRKVILTAMLFCIVGTFGLAAAPNFFLASVAHFISGIGNAFCFLSCIMLISRWLEPSKQSFMIGLTVTIGMFGGFVAQSPFSKLAEVLSWRNALIVDGFIGVFILTLLAAFVYDKEKVSPPEGQTLKEFLGGLSKCFFNLQNVSCGLYVSLMNMPLMIIGAVYGSLFLTQAHGVTLTEASFIISMICMGTIIGSPIVGHFGDQFSKKALMAAGSILSIATFFTIMYVTNTTPAVLTALFLLLGFFTSTQVLGYPLITEAAEKELTGTSMSIAGVLVMGLPMFLGPIAGNIMDKMSITNAETNITTFPLESFHAAFLIFPVGFFVALSLLSVIKEKKAARVRL